MLAEVDSTNRFAADEARRGAPEGLVVLADEQHSGRGRLGRRWVAPAGSALLCSVVLRPALGDEHRHLVSLSLALGALDAIGAISSVPVQLKWPNDLLVGEKKLGGILAEVVPTESGGEGAERTAVVVGLGCNLAFPEGFPSGGADQVLLAGATTLAAEGAVIGRDVLLGALLDAFGRRYGALVAPGGVAATLAEYERVCATLGRRVRVTTARDEWVGVAESLDDRGRLQVRRDREVLVLDAADIVHLRADP